MNDTYVIYVSTSSVVITMAAAFNCESPISLPGNPPRQ